MVQRMHFLVLFSLVITMLGAQTGIHQDIREALDRGETVDPIITLKSEAQLPPIPPHWSKDRKGRFVFNWLKERADQSQSDLCAVLEIEHIRYRSFYLVNAIKVYDLNPAQVKRIATRQEVESILPDPWIRQELPEAEPAIIPRQILPWGLQKIGIDSVWNAGYRGSGIVIGGQDTGYDWDHPALKHSYRGYTADTVIHDYHWHDAVHAISPLHNDSIIDPSNNPCGLDIDEPCDDTNHGTHTMGIMTGREDSLQIGMAPEADWIGCRNMERGYGKPSTYLECFEWFLAPTNLKGEDPDPSLAPHVINNSWTCPEFEGCTPDVFPMMREAIDHLVAAGIVVVVSAGNDGPQCSTIGNPPAMHANSYAVGATMQNDTIARFSSRGPVTVDSSFRLKPDISAPGHWVLSSIPNGNYTFYSGTSMAGPHVAGLVALMIQANPDLEGRVELIEDIINHTAVPLYDSLQCGEYFGQNAPNATYGQGRIDAWAAVQASMDYGTAVDEPETEITELLVFPNPVGQQLTFQASRNEIIEELNIYDTQGRLVYRTVPGMNQWQVNTNSWTSGIFFYRALLRDGWSSGTFIRK